jgi:hypothetical protein
VLAGITVAKVGETMYKGEIYFVARARVAE